MSSICSYMTNHVNRFETKITLKEVFERDDVVHEYKEWDELWHVFQVEALLPESIESFKMFGTFLNKYIGVKV